MLVFEPWPTFEASKLVQTTAVFAITINGKRVGEFVADLNATDADLAQIARDTVATKLNGAEIIKTIVVPKKLVNFVVKK
jgi:leucyl-tRNA synthetase